MTVVELRSAFLAVEQAREQAARVRPFRDRHVLLQNRGASLNDFLTPGEQVIIDDLQIIELWGMSIAHVHMANVDRIVDSCGTIH